MGSPTLLQRLFVTLFHSWDTVSGLSWHQGLQSLWKSPDANSLYLLSIERESSGELFLPYQEKDGEKRVRVAGRDSQSLGGRDINTRNQAFPVEQRNILEG